MLFASGLGLEITDSSVRLARVSFGGRILEIKQMDLPAGLVVDDAVADTEGLKKFLNEKVFSDYQRGRRLPVVLCLPESRVFDVTLKEGASSGVELQKQVPILVKESVVVEKKGTLDREVVQRFILDSFVNSLDSAHADLRAVERNTVSVERFVVNFKDKFQDLPFQAAIGAATRATHPWQYKQASNFLSFYVSKK